MDDNVYHYIVSLPDGVKAFSMPCLDGYTIYTDARLTQESRREAYVHELKHIHHGDFEKADVQEIEYLAHRR